MDVSTMSYDELMDRQTKLEGVWEELDWIIRRMDEGTDRLAKILDEETMERVSAAKAPFENMFEDVRNEYRMIYDALVVFELTGHNDGDF